MEILLDLSLHPAPGPAALAAARAALASADARLLLAKAQEEGLTGLLGVLLQRAGGVPPGLAPGIEAAARGAVAWRLRGDRVHGEVLDRLEDAGLSPVVLKGPAVAERLYDPPRLRDYEDLDLLVPPGSAARAAAALAPLGFRPHEEVPPALARIGARFDGTTTLVREDGLAVDLHERLSRSDFPMGLDEEGMRRRAEAGTLCGRPARSLAPEDLLLHLCAHGCKDLWRRRIWIADLARLLRGDRGIDGAAVVAAAARGGTRRALGVGLALAAARLDGPIRDPDLAREAADPRVRELARWVEEEGARGGPGDRPSDRVRQWRFRERFRDRARLVLGAVLVPRSTDWRALPLPDALVPLLFLFRPVRLAWKWGTRPLRRRP